jgi:hypothetical protein
VTYWSLLSTLDLTPFAFSETALAPLLWAAGLGLPDLPSPLTFFASDTFFAAEGLRVGAGVTLASAKRPRLCDGQSLPVQSLMIVEFELQSLPRQQSLPKHIEVELYVLL